MTTITVAGEAEIERAAELGTVHLSVSTEGPDRQGVVDEAGRIHAAIIAGIVALQDAEAAVITRWTSDGVTVSSARPWNQDGHQLPFVHTATAPISVTFADAGRLSDWLGSVATNDGSGRERRRVVAHGCHDGRGHRRRARAGGEGRVRAAATYAAALALTGLTPVAVADPGLLDRGAPGHGAVPMASVAPHEGSAPAMGFAPQPITIAATVHVRFETA